MPIPVAVVDEPPGADWMPAEPEFWLFTEPALGMPAPPAAPAPAALAAVNVSVLTKVAATSADSVSRDCMHCSIVVDRDNRWQPPAFRFP
jgi:hypothetical protein